MLEHRDVSETWMFSSARYASLAEAGDDELWGTSGRPEAGVDAYKYLSNTNKYSESRTLDLLKRAYKDSCSIVQGRGLSLYRNPIQQRLVGSGGGGDTGLGMMAGTSPSITGLAYGGWEVAFQVILKINMKGHSHDTKDVFKNHRSCLDIRCDHHRRTDEQFEDAQSARPRRR